MEHVATTRSNVGAKLRTDAGLVDVIEAVNDLSATVERRLSGSPSVPLDAEHPSASIVYSDAEYDALAERLESEPAPSDELRRTMGAADTSGR